MRSVKAIWLAMPGDEPESLCDNSTSRVPGEALETPAPNLFSSLDGRTVEVRSMLKRPQNFTYWGLSTLQTLPANYIRI
jgi:hypothetical protein